VHGTIAITDHGWYERLRVLRGLEEVNFWKPSVSRRFHAPEFSPFLFKLRAPHHAICGFAFFACYSILPDWLAWESFGEANGTATFKELQERIATIRDRISFRGKPGSGGDRLHPSRPAGLFSSSPVGRSSARLAHPHPEPRRL
jgi:hypothetical protein